MKLFLDDLQRASEIEKFENDDQTNLYEDEARPYDLDRQSPIKEPQIDMSIMPDLSAQYEVRVRVYGMYFIRCYRWKNEIWIIQLVNSKEINSPNHFHFVLGAIENENNEEEVPSQKISLLVVSRRIFTVITGEFR